MASFPNFYKPKEFNLNQIPSWLYTPDRIDIPGQMREWQQVQSGANQLAEQEAGLAEKERERELQEKLATIGVDEEGNPRPMEEIYERMNNVLLQTGRLDEAMSLDDQVFKRKEAERLSKKPLILNTSQGVEVFNPDTGELLSRPSPALQKPTKKTTPKQESWVKGSELRMIPADDQISRGQAWAEGYRPIGKEESAIDRRMREVMESTSQKEQDQGPGFWDNLMSGINENKKQTAAGRAQAQEAMNAKASEIAQSIYNSIFPNHAPVPEQTPPPGWAPATMPQVPLPEQRNVIGLARRKAQPMPMPTINGLPY